MPEDPETVIVGQIDQSPAGVLEDASYAGKCLKHLRVRRIAEVENPYGFRGTIRISYDPLGILVWNFGKADVGTNDFEFAGGGIARLGAKTHQAGHHGFGYINHGEALLGCLLDIQVLLVALVLEKYFASRSVLQGQVRDHFCGAFGGFGICGNAWRGHENHRGRERHTNGDQMTPKKSLLSETHHFLLTLL